MGTGSHNAFLPTVSEGGENSAPRLPVHLWRQGGGRARPRVAWSARARSTLLAALIIIIIIIIIILSSLPLELKLPKAGMS